VTQAPVELLPGDPPLFTPCGDGSAEERVCGARDVPIP